MVTCYDDLGVTGLGSGFDDMVGFGHEGGLGVGGGLGRGGTRNTQEEDEDILDRRQRMQQRRRMQQQRRRKQQQLKKKHHDDDDDDDVVVREGVNTTPARQRKTKVPGVARHKKHGKRVDQKPGIKKDPPKPVKVEMGGSRSAQGVRLEDLI